MKSTFPRIRNLAMALIALPVVAFCGKTIPVEELSQAKYDIARAEAVRAEKYAPEKFDAAKKSLFSAHEQVEKEDMKEAKKLAEEASALAKESFAIAAPQLAQDTRTEADNAIRAADDAYAEEFAPTEFQNAKAAFAAGDDNFAKQAYVDSFRKFEESREEANKALVISEAQIEMMKRQIAEIEDRIREAETYGANQSAPDTMRKARESTALAKQRIEEKKLKLATDDIKAARENAELAAKLSRKEWARKKFVEAEAAVTAADRSMINLRSAAENEQGKKALENSTEAQDALSAAEETLEAAKDSLRRAEDEYKKENYQTSYNHSEEAIRLARIVNEQIPDAELALVQAARRQAEEKASSPGERKGTKTQPEGEELSDDGWKTYKVRLIPERRDCLWRIAEYKFIYNNARLWPKIYRANKRQIKNPDLIYPGQIFDIPPKHSNATVRPTGSKSSGAKKVEPKKTVPPKAPGVKGTNYGEEENDYESPEDGDSMDENERPVNPSDEYEEETDY